MLKELSAVKLNLSFEFELLSFEWRKPRVNIKGMLREIKYSEEYFDWFMEDIIYFLEKNDIKKRWDIAEIQISGLENLNLTKEELALFRKQLSTIMVWDMKEI